MLFRSGGKYQQSSLFRSYTRCFGRTGCNNFTMPKAKTKGSKNRDGRSNGNLNSESAKETMLSEKRGYIRVRAPFIISSCIAYIS